MYCENCGAEISDNASFCSACGNKVGNVSHKNIYVALLLTFILTGIGSIYAGNVKKGLILLAIRLLTAVIGLFLNIFLVLSVLVWTYGFYEAYRDVQIANGHENPKLINDFKGWNQNNQIIAGLIVVIILIFTVAGCASVLTVGNIAPEDPDTQYYLSHNSGSSSSHSSHYGGVDDSPGTIAKNDPDWYYDHYEYGDNDQVDEYLESQGYE